MMKPNRPFKSKGSPYPQEFREEAVRYWLSSGQLNFLRIVDTPMFEFSPTEGRFNAMHHPFCLPNSEDMALLEEGFTSELPLGSTMHREAACGLAL
jgi:aspartyl-tRNA synthetase